MTRYIKAFSWPHSISCGVKFRGSLWSSSFSHASVRSASISMDSRPRALLTSALSLPDVYDSAAASRKSPLMREMSAGFVDLSERRVQQILQREGVSSSNIRTKLSDEEQIGVIKRLAYRP